MNNKPTCSIHSKSLQSILCLISWGKRIVITIKTSETIKNEISRSNNLINCSKIINHRLQPQSEGFYYKIIIAQGLQSKPQMYNACLRISWKHLLKWLSLFCKWCSPRQMWMHWWKNRSIKLRFNKIPL